MTNNSVTYAACVILTMSTLFFNVKPFKKDQ